MSRDTDKPAIGVVFPAGMLAGMFLSWLGMVTQ